MSCYFAPGAVPVRHKLKGRSETPEWNVRTFAYELQNRRFAAALAGGLFDTRIGDAWRPFLYGCYRTAKRLREPVFRDKLLRWAGSKAKSPPRAGRGRLF
jgi:hypothetical protein